MALRPGLIEPVPKAFEFEQHVIQGVIHGQSQQQNWMGGSRSPTTEVVLQPHELTVAGLLPPSDRTGRPRRCRPPPAGDSSSPFRPPCRSREARGAPSAGI